MKKSWKGYLLTAPMMAGCLIFYIIPFFMVVYYSLRSGMGKNSEFSGLENYRQILGNGTFHMAAGNTLRFLVVSLPLALVLSYVIALGMDRKRKQYGAVSAVFLLPYTMPIVGNILLVETLFSGTGAMNQVMGWFGFSAKDWMGSSAAFAVVVLLYLWKNTGYSVVLLVAGLVTIPGEQYASAEIDGAGPLQKFLYITTPQMWYAVFFSVLFSLINAFKCFREIFLIGGKHPNTDIYMLQHFINNSFEALNYTRLSAASVLLFLVTTVSIGVLYWWVDRREEYRK